MKNKLSYWLVLVSYLVISPQIFAKNNLPAPGASPDVVHLRLNCGTMPDCAEAMSDLLDWIWGTRAPSAANPLLVDIGAGTFNIGAQEIPLSDGSTIMVGTSRVFCEDSGHVTFRGAGRANTILTGRGVGTPPAGFQIYVPVLTIRNCENLAFQDLDIAAQSMISSDQQGVAVSTDKSEHGIIWWGGGSSTWSNIGVLAGVYGWFDACSGGGVPGEHKWFGSSVQSGPAGYYNIAYRSDCGKNEFFGGEIKAIKGNNNTAGSLIGVQTGHANGSMAIYGSLVRALFPATSASPGYLNNAAGSEFLGHGGLYAQAGTIHMHGGIVSALVESSGVDSEVFGAKADAGGKIHTPDTAFGLKPGGSGKAERVIGMTVMAPYQWPSDMAPPSITSMTGYDTFIETDCDSQGNCDNATGPTHPHFMIYDANCNGGTDPWFNSTLGECRGVDPAP